MQLSVVIPAYNEAANIQDTVDRCVHALRALCDAFEIIVVDDHSTDGTDRLADELSARYPEVRVIHHSRNLGQGASLVTGFKQVRYGLVTHNAMDYPFHLEDVARVFPLLDAADVVVAARKSRPESSLYRRLLTTVNLFLLRNCFGLRLKDYNFIQVYKREVLEAIQLHETSTGFLAPSILFQAHRLGYRIVEIVLDYWPRERGEAKSGSPRVLFSTLRDMCAFWRRDRLRRRRRGVPPYPTKEDQRRYANRL